MYIPRYIESAPRHVRQHTSVTFRQMVELVKLVSLTAVQVHVFSHANAQGHVPLGQIVFAKRYHADGQYRKR